MTSLFVGIYGIYLLLVGARGNTGAFINNVTEDAPGYIPWLFSIIIIALLSENETTEKLVKPFIALVILNFVLMNFKTVSEELSKIYALSGR